MRGGVAISVTEQSRRQLLPAESATPIPARRPALVLVDAPGSSAQDEPLSLSVLRSAEGVAATRAVWLELGGHGVEADPEHFLWSLRAEEHVVRPHVVVVSGPGGPRTIAAGRIVDVQLPCKLGTRTPFAPRVRALCVTRNGILGRLDAVTAPALLDELEGALTRGEADVLLFRQVGEGTPLHAVLSVRASLLERRQRSARSNLRWQVDLPSSLDEYLGTLSSSTRKSARRTARRLEHELGSRVSIRAYGSAEDVAECLDEIEAVAARSYQRQLGVGYLGDAAQRRRMAMLARHGWLRAFVLFVDGRPAAYELGELYRGRYHSLAGGYDPDYARLGVGGHLLLHAIGAFAEDPDVTVFDFGFGDSPYKHKLGRRALLEGDLILYAHRPRPQLVSVARTAVLELSRLLTRSLERLSLLEALRRRARRPWRYRTGTACSPGSPRTT
jgi:CelD/BcsL family acetyltransferase involved in cellulose biosynthesis